MKKLILLLLLLITAFSKVLAGGGGGGGPTVPCTDAQPFCTSNTYSFPNETNTTAPSGPNYGCLGSEPNPVWFYMQIDVAGPMTFTITQSSTQGGAPDLDVDYALWGPFSSVSNGCTSITNGSSAPIDCSYSIDPVEIVTIPNAVVNQFYIIIITNYDGGAGFITFNQTGGSGVADCGLVTPCDMTNLTATPSACNPANSQYSVSGTITFVSPPASGTLTVTSSCGGSQTFNAPFGTTANYNLTGLNSNGAACVVTATFSADQTCTRTQNYTAPPACSPLNCNITGITTNVGACNPVNNQYAVSGNISFTNAPASGTLTITGSCGGTQTYNAPFTSPAAYNFTGLTSNGAPCNISAVFSAAPTCTISQNYTAPANCIPPCNMASLNATIGSCLPDNTFTVTGDFTYQNAPGTGTIVVTVTNSSGSLTQTFNPPFVNNQVYNFSIPGNTSNGSALTVTVAFSNAPACLLSVSSISPSSCDCVAEIGTFTATTTGPGIADYILCFGDEIDITADGNYTPPAPANNPPLPEGYEPGITWLVYSCPPTIAVTPSNVPPNDFIGNDPCLIGLYSDFDMYDINDQFWMTNYPGVFTNNTVYFVPITMYNLTEAFYSYVNTSVDCYEMGTPFAVQYLTDITFTQAQSCSNVTVTISGGLPALNGSQFTGSNLTPANASFVNTTTNNGGTISIAGLTSGQAYSFQVTDANGCPKTISGTFIGEPTLSYPQTTYCPVGTASPTITGTIGGTYSSTAGLSINPSTGIINLAASTPNTYTVTYTTPTVPGPACPTTFVITINPLPTIVANDVTVCEGGTIAITAAGATSYTWSPPTYLSSTTGASVNFVNGVTTNYTVVGTDLNGCVNSEEVSVTVNDNPAVNAGPDLVICIGSSVLLNATGATTYTWDNGVSNGIPFTPTVGTITYTVIGTTLGCTSTDQVVVTVNPLPVVFAGNNVIVCEGSTVTLTGSGANTYTWNPVISNGIAFIPTLGTTTYTVTGTSAAGCINTDQVDVIVGPVPVVSFTPDVTIGCAPLTVNLTNTTANSADCVWSISNGIVLTGCGTVPVTFTQGGCYDVTLTTTSNNGCVGTLTSTNLICVEALPIASFNPSSNVLSTLNTEVLFTNTSTGATSYLWNFGDESPSSNETNPTNIYPGEPGTYQVMLVAYSPLGCTDTAYTTIIIYEELIFYIPNTFTPDDDNFNPIFQPVFTAGFDPYDFTLLIFNRWGEIIFESHDASIGWNGTYGSNGEIEMCQDGTYTWKIEFKTNKNDERKMVVGHVNLIR
jgi:gliding motility-associated-like protein